MRFIVVAIAILFLTSCDSQPIDIKNGELAAHFPVPMDFKIFQNQSVTRMNIIDCVKSDKTALVYGWDIKSDFKEDCINFYHQQFQNRDIWEIQSSDIHNIKEADNILTIEKPNIWFYELHLLHLKTSTQYVLRILANNSVYQLEVAVVELAVSSPDDKECFLISDSL